MPTSRPSTRPTTGPPRADGLGELVRGPQGKPVDQRERGRDDAGVVDRLGDLRIGEVRGPLVGVDPVDGLAPAVHDTDLAALDVDLAVVAAEVVQQGLPCLVGRPDPSDVWLTGNPVGVDVSLEGARGGELGLRPPGPGRLLRIALRLLDLELTVDPAIVGPLMRECLRVGERPAQADAFTDGLGRVEAEVQRGARDVQIFGHPA